MNRMQWIHHNSIHKDGIKKLITHVTRILFTFKFAIITWSYMMPHIAYTNPKTTDSKTSHANNNDEDLSIMLSHRSDVKLLIQSAISEGVPLYNRGDADACRSVYMITAQAIQFLAPVFEVRYQISNELIKVKTMSSSKGAWALRILLDQIYQDLESLPKISQSKESSTQFISNDEDIMDTKSTHSGYQNTFSLDFTSGLEWYTINDAVMGGVSSGGLTIKKNDQLKSIGVFSGQLSMENNGGFSSTRVQISPNILTEYRGLELKVRGDLREYVILVTTRETRGSWQESFTPQKEWSTIRIPFEQMRLHFRGRLHPRLPKVKPNEIKTVGLMIKDKKEQPFRLEIRWIRAWK